jgi:hypothetical protein
MCGSPSHKICTASLDNAPLIDGFVFWPILSHHELSLDQISYYAFHDWLRFLLLFSRLARPDWDQSGESGLRSDRLTISSTDPIHSCVCVQPPHAPRRGDRPQPARPVPSSALAQTHRRGGGHAGRPGSPRPNSQAGGDTPPTSACAMSAQLLRILADLGHHVVARSPSPDLATSVKVIDLTVGGVRVTLTLTPTASSRAERSPDMQESGPGSKLGRIQYQ